MLNNLIIVLAFVGDVTVTKTSSMPLWYVRTSIIVMTCVTELWFTESDCREHIFHNKSTSIDFDCVSQLDAKWIAFIFNSPLCISSNRNSSLKNHKNKRWFLNEWQWISYALDDFELFFCFNVVSNVSLFHEIVADTIAWCVLFVKQKRKQVDLSSRKRAK